MFLNIDLLPYITVQYTMNWAFLTWKRKSKRTNDKQHMHLLEMDLKMLIQKLIDCRDVRVL